MSNIPGLLKKYEGRPEERFFKELFEENEYEPVSRVKADVVVDAGALAGEFCSYIYDRAGVIYALEPYSEHYAELEENIKEFDLTKIKPYRLALAGESGERNLLIQSRGGHTLGGDPQDKPFEVVKIKSLAGFMKDEGIDHIDILKVDIESAENEVFNSPDFLEVADKITMIIGEHLGDLKDKFTSLGFKFSEHKNNQVFERTHE